MKMENTLLNIYNKMIKGRKVLQHNNSILTINPYYHAGMWVFDDDRVGLVKEPFVAGADDFIDHMLRTKGVRDEAKKGFTLMFALTPFRSSNGGSMTFQEFADGGTVYTPDGEYADFTNKNKTSEVWLCPALNLYFPESPEKIYFDFKVN